MKNIDILTQLRKLDVRVDVVEGDLRLRGRTDRLTTDLIGHVRTAKPALLAMLRGTEAEPSIKPRPAAERHQPQPLSFSQRRLWFLDQLIPNSALYNVAGGIRLTGTLDRPALLRVLTEVVRRHEILRTRFRELDGVPSQEVLPAGDFDLRVTDLTDSSAKLREEEVERLAAEEAETPFDLATGPLLRCRLLIMDDTDHVLQFALHHIVSDGWSTGILIREISALYEAFIAGRASPLDELHLQYADFAGWQHQQMKAPRFLQQLAYWQETLDGVPPLLDLPLDRPRTAARRHLGANHRFRVSAKGVGALNGLSRRENATLFMTLHAAWALLLSRSAGQDDICTGTPAASRDRPELEGLIGFFVNTLALRTRVDERQSFAALLQQTKRCALDAFANGQVPFEQVIEALDLVRDATHAPLVQAMFVLHNLETAALKLPSLNVTSLVPTQVPARFELTLTAVPTGRELACSLEYDRDLFDPATIAQLAERFLTLLDALAFAPDVPLREVPWLDAEAVRRILIDSRGPAVADAPASSIRRAFEAQAATMPEQVAILHRGEAVSYRALNTMANAVASRLQNAGAGPGALVALFAERSIELIAGLLGVLKAGAAYLPLDPNHPRERLRHMMEDARPAYALVQPDLQDRLPGACKVICLQGSGEDAGNPTQDDDPNQLAYVIYTSGSSGRPKGVAVTGGNLLAATTARLSSVSPYRALLFMLSFSFDGALGGFFGTLLGGGTLVLPEEEEVGDPASLAALMQEHRIDTLSCTPSLYMSLLREATDAQLAGLRQIMIGGEAWTLSLAQLTAQRCPAARLFNEYGPSEATIWASVHEVGPDLTTDPPIGHPIAGMQLHVLDRLGRLSPQGMVGELFIGGAGVSRGYLNRPDLTAERFVPDPFGPPGGRLYRTGDIVRRQATGELLYLGRGDEQVKIRGYRIELGEVEAALHAVSGVRDAAVLAGGEGEARQLVAYVVAPGVKPASLRSALGRQLPDYMVPSRFVLLDHLPVTANGKLDRSSLPELDLPELAGPGEHAPYVAPRDAVEDGLASIWATVLGLQKVGLDDNFFALGGHSLLATQLISKVRRAWGQVPLRLIFEAPTVGAFAARLRENNEEPCDAAPAPPAIGQAPSGPQPLSFAQQRLWFLDQFEPGSAFYNMPNALRVSGVLDVMALQRSLAEILRRHSVLRTGFPMHNGSPVQVVTEPAGSPLQVLDLRELDHAEREAKVQQHTRAEARTPFDLAHGPLMRAVLLRLGGAENVLLITMHHIAADGWSLGILVRELTVFYDAFAAGRPSPLPELTRQYADFSHWQRNWLTGEALTRQLDYWVGQLTSAPPLLALPVDMPRPAMQRHRGRSFAFTIPDATVDGLRDLAARAKGTLFMAVAAGFGAFLSRITGQTDLCVGTPIANRNHAEIEDLIGFFVNTLVLRVWMDSEPSFETLLRQVRGTMLDAYAHQDLPFELLVEQLSPDRQTSYAPLFQTMLVLQNVPGGALRLPGLEFRPEPLDNNTSKFDLSLYIAEQDGALAATFEYNTDLFLPDTIRRMADNLCNLLASLVADPRAKVGAVPMLGANELAELRAWNDTAQPCPAGQTLHTAFEAQVVRTPDAEALRFGALSLSYDALNRRANRMAHALRRAGAGPDRLVGLCTHRSAEMVVALLAILKAGSAYLPLDPSYPADRIAYMIADACPLLVLTEPAVAERLRLDPATCLMLDPGQHAAEAAMQNNPPRHARAANLAYVIYTSGSTGQPKGTAITHASASAFLAWAARTFEPDALQHVLASTSIGFDLSVFEIFAPLCTGGAVMLVRDILEVIEAPGRYPVTLINTVPSAIAALHRADALPASVRVINLAGEALPNTLVQALYRHPSVQQVFNLYGPTEDTTYSTFALIARGAQGACSIGHPIANTRAYLLDTYGNPSPAGVTGQLFLAGDGLARGYLNRPGLTAERFVPDPFGPAGTRMYATGDLARRRPDGAIEFLGRIDSQVKLRGFRIELGEVEEALRSLADVRDAAVVIGPCAGGEPGMIAYVVPAEATAADTDVELAQWSETFDTIYETAAPVRFDFNIAGWNNSYDKTPFSRMEMEEWVDGTVERIAALAPRRVLEVGCGTGLLLHRIAPRCTHYVGTDISQAAVAQVLAAVAKHPPGDCRVELHHGALEALPGTSAPSFDTVIINSVVQYFPDAAYLTTALSEIVSRVADGGHVYVGDVRHLGLLRAFHTSIELFHASDDTAGERLRQAVRQDVDGEAELLVDPAYFLALRRILPRLSNVAVLPKPGRTENELTRFRYDVVMTIAGPEPVTPAAWRTWSEVESSLEALSAGDVLAVRDIVDTVTAPAVASADALLEDRIATAGQLRAACEGQEAVQAVDRRDLFRRCASKGVRVAFATAGGSQGHCHAVLFRDGAEAGSLDSIEIDWSALYDVHGEDLSRHTNQPSARQRRFALRNDLRRQLQHRLPDYLMPSQFIMLQQLPLTSSGKIDRKALPASEVAEVGQGQDGIGPRTPTERILAEIWTEILATDRVGIKDNFFSLGGHSLLATRVVSRVRNVLGVELPVRALFEMPTIAELGHRIDTGSPEGGDAPVPPITPIARSGHMPTSFAQQRLWVLYQLDPDSPFYNMPIGLRLTGILDMEALSETLTEVVRRHEVLRTTLRAVDGVPVQVVAPPTRIVPVFRDFSALPQDERDNLALAAAQADALAPFDLAAGPLLRVQVLRLSAQEHVLLCSMHHIVSDGWSIGLLTQEIAALYAAYHSGLPSPLPQPLIQYADFSAWQRKWLSGEIIDRQLDYWKLHLAGMPPLLPLPTDLPRPAVQRFRGSAHSFSVPPDITKLLRGLGSRRDATMFMILVAAFDILLARYSGQTDIGIGIAIANRSHRELEKLLGFFVNTLVLRVQVDAGASFETLLAQVRAVTLDAYANQDVPFEQVVEALNPERHLSYAPLIQVTLVLQNAPKSDLVLPGLTVAPIGTRQSTSRYDLSINMSEEGERLLGQFEYNTDLFEPGTIARMSAQFTTLLESIALDTAFSVRELSAIAAGSSPAAVAADDEAGWMLPALIHQRFEAYAAVSPDAIAVRFEETAIGYGELNARANRLGHHLRAQGLGPESLVALHLNRSVEMVVTMLGVLKAGAAYLPLDPAYPAERLSYILGDARCDSLITMSHLPDLPAQAATIRIDDDWPTISGFPAENPEAVARAGNLAYVIYTSGSTGRPKGVCLSHQGACNLSDAQIAAFGMRPGQRVLQFASLSFDAATWEVIMALTSGATLQLAPRDALLPGLSLERTLRRHGVQVATLPPVALASLSPAALPELHTVISAGEACPAGIAASWAVQGRRFFNAYGPTETTVCATLQEVPSGSAGTPSIGHPIANMRVAVLDEWNEPVPQGAIGELMVSGPGVARGYLGQPALTAERFSPSPFGPPGSRMYRTGDLVRQVADGTLQFVGRIDDQVKLRGLRIELGEVESALAAQPGVRSAAAAVVSNAAGSPVLVAYIVPDASPEGSNRWTDSFEQIYGSSTILEDQSFDLVGWNRMSDSTPIPAVEMEEWVAQTVSRILALAPRRVLEIGCGTGLLVHRIAPAVTAYLATDFSTAALTRLDSGLRTAGIDNVVLKLAAADETESLPGNWDTVVANSVLQYFPSRDYLGDVLVSVIARVPEGGHVFLGDVRHFGLMRPFHTALELDRSQMDTRTMADLETAVSRSERLDAELFIDPAFFFALWRENPRIGQVDVRIKAGSVDNELTEFRYDVVLHIGARPRKTSSKWRSWAGLATMETWLAEAPRQTVTVRDIPDARIALASYVASQFGQDDAATLAEIQADFVMQPVAAADIRDLMALAARFDAMLEIAPATGSGGRLHAAFRRAEGDADWASLYPLPVTVPLVNDPTGRRRAELKPAEVIRGVRQILPEYMVPSQAIVLEQLPITPNGKIDRAALPNPEPAHVSDNEAADWTDTETMLGEIWVKLLGLEHVGLHDDFFELGGHSLLAIQMIAAINLRFGVELSLPQLFQTSTLSALAEEIVTNRPKREVVGRMKVGQAGTPLFLLHPSGGQVFCYAELVASLPSDWPVYGVSSFEAAGRGQSPDRLETLAGAYADEIEQTVASGPLCLAGWSLGGVLAFAVASLLERRGREVVWIALLDAPIRPPAESERTSISVSHVVAWMLSMPAAEALLRYGRDFEALRTRVRGLVDQEGIDAFVHLLLHDREGLETSLDFPGLLQDQLLAHQRGMNTALELTDQFTPEPVAAPLHVFWAEETLRSGADRHAWQPYTQSAGRSTSVELPGRHFNFVMGEHAVTLAKHLGDLSRKPSNRAGQEG